MSVTASNAHISHYFQLVVTQTHKGHACRHAYVIYGTYYYVLGIILLSCYEIMCYIPIPTIFSDKRCMRFTNRATKSRKSFVEKASILTPVRWVKLSGKCAVAIEMGNKEDKEELFVETKTFVFRISFKEVKRSQGRNILKAHQSETSLNTKMPKMKIEAILTVRI